MDKLFIESFFFQYFGETAHNPETNQRPRLRSPERLTQKQKRAIGMIPANTARARQSWICSPPGSENQGTVSHYGLRKDSLSLSEDQAIANESSTASAPALLQRKSLDDRTQRRASPPSLNQKEAPLDPTLRSNRYLIYFFSNYFQINIYNFCCYEKFFLLGTICTTERDLNQYTPERVAIESMIEYRIQSMREL